VVNTANMVDRISSASADQRYDTFASTQVAGGGSVWEIAVPNGTYQVFLVAGDATRNNSIYRYNVESSLSLSGTPTTTKRWITGSNTVSVTDGRLSLSNGTGASNNKILLRLEGLNGRTYRIDVSDDMLTWQTVTTVQDADGTLSFDDPVSRTKSQRFYRATFSP
jgi:hypothetical protein